MRKTSVLGLFLGASRIHHAYVRLHDEIPWARITIRGCAPGAGTLVKGRFVKYRRQVW